MTTFETFDHIFRGQGNSDPVPARRHPRGRGIVAATAFVSDSAFIDVNAEVSGTAQVFDGCTLEGNAQVGGQAILEGNVKIKNESQVGGHARLKGWVVVQGRWIIGGRARIEAIPDSRGDWGSIYLQGVGTIKGQAIIQSYDLTLNGPAEIKSRARILVNRHLLAGESSYEWTIYRAIGGPVLRIGCQTHPLRRWTPAFQRKLVKRYHDSIHVHQDVARIVEIARVAARGMR